MRTRQPFDQVRAMKGPGMRLDLDVRRLWRCQACGTERHTTGGVTFVRCHFCREHPAMSLVEPPRPQREPAAPLDLTIELHPDDIDAPAFVPPHLREAEPSAPAETMSEIIAQPQPDTDEAASPTATATATADEQEQTAADSADAPAGEEQPPKRRKKKRRNRRQRRRNRSAQSEGDSEPAPQTESPTSSKSDDSFGNGIVP